MQGAKRAVLLCCTSDLQRSSAPKAGAPNVHVICEQALRDAEITNIPFLAALTGALRRFNPLV